MLFCGSSLVGLVAAGCYICFFGGVRGAIWAGAGVAGLELGSFLFPEKRFAVPLLTALWVMLAEILWGEGAGFRYKLSVERREKLFLAGGVWLMARSLAEICTGNILLQTGLLRTALAAALFVMAGLHLLGRGRLHALWMAALAALWMLVGFLGSLAYAENWQMQVMAVSLYAAVGGILVFQQIFCIRQELDSNGRLERRRESLEAPPGMLSGASPAAWVNSGIEVKWQEEAMREYRELAIFEHDFRHHLDIVAALYEEGSGEEARSYIEDLKQARESRQGRITGGERELSHIMMAKRKACRQAEISFSYQIVGSPRGIARMDMTALLLNLLDNAIRACEAAPKPRSIGVMLLSRGELWEIEMVNSGRCEPGGVRAEQRQRESQYVKQRQGESRHVEQRQGESQHAEQRQGESQHAEQRQGESQHVEQRQREVLQAGPQQAERQREGVQGGMGRKVHGIGMVSVRQIVDKYQGICRIWEEDGQVRQKLILVQRSGPDGMPDRENTDFIKKGQDENTE